MYSYGRTARRASLMTLAVILALNISWLAFVGLHLWNGAHTVENILIHAVVWFVVLVVVKGIIAILAALVLAWTDD